MEAAPNTNATFSAAQAAQTQVVLEYGWDEDEMTGARTRSIRLVQHPSSFPTGPEGASDPSFLQAMDHFTATGGKTFGEKGHEAYTSFGVGDQRLPIFQMLRTTPRQTLKEYVRNCVSQAQSLEKEGNLAGSVEIQLDLFRLVFQTRDKDEGKGERDLTKWMLIELHKWYPKSVRILMRRLPEKFGYWGDIMSLIELFEAEMSGAPASGSYRAAAAALPSGSEQAELKKTVKYLLDFVKETFLKDESSEKTTLLAKWIAKEGQGGHKTKLARRFAIMFGADEQYLAAKKLQQDSPSGAHSDALQKEKTRMYRAYRQRVSALNKKIGTVEILQCDQRWSEIPIGSVPARHLAIRSKALQNKVAKKKKGQISDVRCPDDPDRIQCAKNMEAHFEKVKKGEVTMKASGLFIYELVKRYMAGSDRDETWEMQFQAICDKAPALDYFTCVADTSGSMSGDPIIVAISLAALIAKKSKYFANRYVSFNTVPKWKMIDPDADLFSIVKQMQADSDWGGSTNFEMTMDLMIKVAKDYKIPEEFVRQMKLVVVSDMQFDAASANSSYGGYYGGYGSSRQPPKKKEWKDSAARIKKAWRAAGYGEGVYPEMIYWNVRDSGNMVATADTPGVQMLSGYNQEMLKVLIMAGEISKGREVTPMDTLRTAIDGQYYDEIAETLAKVGEGVFVHLTVAGTDAEKGDHSSGVMEDPEMALLQERMDRMERMTSK